MGNIKSFVLAGAAMVASMPAFAADLAPMMRAPVMAPVAEEFSGWYLRGDVGVGRQNFDTFAFTQTNVATGGAFPASFRIDQKDIKDTSFFGAGIGYQFNSWFRIDVTGEYRASSKIKALGSYTEFCPAGRCFDLYDGDHQASVFLANAYVDLGTWWCLTPFVGAGVGVARHTVTALTDTGFVGGGSAVGFADAERTTNSFAWAVHAGLAYNVTNNVKIELAYRYLNMGDADTAEVNCGSGGCNVVGGGPRAFYTLNNMTSQDFKLGVRWLFNEPSVAAPLVRKG
jgi:opacity protein-like surface antigen